MSSRRHRDRSRSPSRALDRRDRSPSRRNSERPIGHREYRQRDYYDDYCDQRDYGNGNQPRGDSHFDTTRIPVQTTNIIIDYYGVADPTVAINCHGPGPPDDVSRGRAPVANAQMGRDGRQRPLLPPSRAESERPKRQIPEAMRDKCGACRKKHDIRFCPYPNTEDGRTKICPICDTSKHAWHLCAHYDKEDTRLQWEVCWVNRRGLPTLVHENSLHKIFLTKFIQEDEETPLEDRLRTLNTKAGPLSPAFVKRLMPPKDSDDYVQQQLRDGRLLPWHLDKEVLESPVGRPDRVIEDPATKDMQLDNFIPGTKTSYVPKAGKQKYFQ